MSELCEFEREVLAMLAGTGPAVDSPSAMIAALGFLKGSGLVAIRGGNYVITDKGRKAIGL